MIKQIFTALYLSFMLAQAGQAAEGRLFFKASVRIPPGDSSISFVISPPQKITPFKILFAYSPNCVYGYLTPEVRYEGSSDWNEALKSGLFYTTDDRNVNELQFRWRSPQTFEQTCDISVLRYDEIPLPPDPQPTPDPLEPEPAPGVWREAGILNYPGGDFKQAGIKLDTTFLAQELLLGIPDNCSVTVSELGVIRSGAYVIATPSSEKANLFKLEQVSSFDQVKVTVSGPKDQVCPIILYVLDQSRSDRTDLD